MPKTTPARRNNQRDYAFNEIFLRFMSRWTPAEKRHLEVIKQRHLLYECPFVEAMLDDRPAGYLESARDMRTEDSWDDPEPFVGVVCRHNKPHACDAIISGEFSTSERETLAVRDDLKLVATVLTARDD